MMVSEPIVELMKYPPSNVRVVYSSGTTSSPSFSSLSSHESSASSMHATNPLGSDSYPSYSSWFPTATSSPGGAGSQVHHVNRRAAEMPLVMPMANDAPSSTPAQNISYYELDGEQLKPNLYKLAIATALTLLVGIIQVHYIRTATQSYSSCLTCLAFGQLITPL